LDFEIALLEAIKWNWPKSKLQGSFFHFIKCQIHKLRELGFSKKEYRKDTYRLVTLLSALPFVENGIVISVFECIKSQDLFKDYSDFFEYFEKTWLYGNFPISFWNVGTKTKRDFYKSQEVKHTNNTLESFH
jgi:hypothetical protein